MFKNSRTYVHDEDHSDCPTIMTDNLAVKVDENI